MILEYKNHSESQRILKRKFPSMESFYEHLIQSVSKKRSHSNYKRVLDYILTHINKDTVKLYVQDIADALSICYNTAHRAIEWLRENCLIWTIHERDPNREDRLDALTFEIPLYFFDPAFRSKVTWFLSSCALMMTWILAVSINAAGLPIRESGDGFSLRYIREEIQETKSKRKQSCVITAAKINKQLFHGGHHDPSSPVLNKTFPEKGMMMSDRRIVSEVLKYVTLDDNQLFILDSYTDGQIEKALARVQKVGPNNPSTYFMGILRSLQAESQKAGRTAATYNATAAEKKTQPVSTSERFAQYTATNKSQAAETTEDAFIRLTKELDGWNKALDDYKHKTEVPGPHGPIHIAAHLKTFLTKYGENIRDRVQQELIELIEKNGKSSTL